MLPKLNFPDYEFRFKKRTSGELLIFDTIRKKFVELSPEEWVRQHLIQFLIIEKKFPKSLFAVETGVKLNNTKKRTDILVYNLQKKVILLAECKAPSVKITKQTLEQALRYNLQYQSSFIILTNGFEHFPFFVENNGKIRNIEQIPDYKLIANN